MLKYLEEIHKISEEFNIPIYFVGGYVRDLLLNIPNDDIDLLTESNPFIVAKKVAERLSGTIIVLDDVRCIYRVVLKKNEKIITFDFSGFEKGRLYDNLINRDFTINSLALPLKTYLAGKEYMELPKEAIIDYSGGINDLKDMIIKVNQDQAFLQDPIRLLRAFRLAAIYNLKVDQGTLELISRNSYLIKEVSGERIRDEFFKLLKCNRSIEYINHMWEIGLLSEIFPEIIDLNKTEQNGYHSVNVWLHCLQAMASLEKEKWIDTVGSHLNNIREYLAEELTTGRSKYDLLKFTLLFHDCGKPATKGMKDNGRITFYGHDELGAKLIRKICDRLVLSTKEKVFVSHIIKYHMGPLMLFNLKSRSDTAIRKFFRKIQPEAIGILLHAYSDKNASRGALQKKEVFVQLKLMITELIELYFRDDMLQNYQPVLTGKELMAEFNLPSGLQIGKIQAKLEEEYFKRGKITKEEAVNFCKELLIKKSMHRA